jgi:hypothetical protein
MPQGRRRRNPTASALTPEKNVPAVAVAQRPGARQSGGDRSARNAVPISTYFFARTVQVIYVDAEFIRCPFQLPSR